MHYLVNAVTEAEGSPAAVLIRALDPLEGVDVMRRRRAAKRPGRATIDRHALCRGPGNLTTALAIDLGQNTLDLTDGPLSIERGPEPPGRLVWSPRVGIRVGTRRRWRCHWDDHPAVSRR
jgi:DNA-3-methyladenine glycosylase